MSSEEPRGWNKAMSILFTNDQPDIITVDAVAAPSAPGAGRASIFFDAADNKLKKIEGAGAPVEIGGGGAINTALFTLNIVFNTAGTVISTGPIGFTPKAAIFIGEGSRIWSGVTSNFINVAVITGTGTLARSVSIGMTGSASSATHLMASDPARVAGNADTFGSNTFEGPFLSVTGFSSNGIEFTSGVSPDAGHQIVMQAFLLVLG